MQETIQNLREQHMIALPLLLVEQERIHFVRLYACSWFIDSLPMFSARAPPMYAVILTLVVPSSASFDSSSEFSAVVPDSSSIAARIRVNAEGRLGLAPVTPGSVLGGGTTRRVSVSGESIRQTRAAHLLPNAKSDTGRRTHQLNDSRAC